MLPLLIMPYVIKKIEADGFGEVAIAQVVMLFFTAISDYGFNLTATRDVSLNRGNRFVISKIVFTVLISRILISLVLFLLLVLSILVIPYLRSHTALYLLAFASVIGQSLLMNWLFQGIEKMKFILYISLFARVVFVLLVICFIRVKSDNIYFIFFTGIGNILAGIISIAFAFKTLKLKIIIPSFSSILDELKNGWHIAISNLSVNIYMYVNVMVLRLFTTDAIVGYYSIAEKIILAARQVLGVYFLSIYPRVCQLTLTGKREVFLFFKKYYVPFLIVILGGCFVLFLFPQPIVSFFLTSHQDIPAHYLRILSFVPFIVCLNIPAYQVLLAHDEKKILFRVFISGTIINIVLNMFFVRTWGPVGTSYVVLITESLITIGLIYEMTRNHKTRLI